MPNPYFPEATLTPDGYWAHQPPQVRVLRSLASQDVAIAAVKLADQGFIIDVPIMVYQWDPVTIMGLRQQYGYTWVPNGKQANVQVVPGLNFPGLPNYDPKNPPPGSIKVSIDAADYPAFDPPAPPPPPPDTNKVGYREYANVYNYGSGSKDANGFIVLDGEHVTEHGKNYVAHRSTGLFGETLYFVQV